MPQINPTNNFKIKPHRKQFLLSKSLVNLPHLEHKTQISDYHLYLGEDSLYCSKKTQTKEIHFLGSMYDWQQPKLTNEQILERLFTFRNFEHLFELVHDYLGHYVLIVRLDKQIMVFNDATAQKEVYYDTAFEHFATQPKLIAKVIGLQEHTDQDAVNYYNSKIFDKKKLFVGGSTHAKNILHLYPNHYLHVQKSKSKRFYPTKTLSIQPLDFVARKAAQILKGYLKAIAHRQPIKLGVTSGYDSRPLFLASLDLPCKYYLAQHKNMPLTHPDIVVAKKLTTYYNKGFSLESDELLEHTSNEQSYLDSIDFDRELNMITKDNHHVYINGNISEIARNAFGYMNNATGRDLCYIIALGEAPFVTKLYNQWLEDKDRFEQTGLHYLDMFYWEERMRNWVAKAKTENAAQGRDLISPFNSRGLLEILLSTQRKDRDYHKSTLYDRLIWNLANMDDNFMKIPINPFLKQKAIKGMKNLGLYHIYQVVGIKTRILKPIY